MINALNKEITVFLNSIEGCSKKSIEIINEKYSSTITDDLSNGHITSNVCMVAASILKLNPKELSIQLAKQLNDLSIYEKVEAAGPGFVNITLKRNDFLSILETIQDKKDFFGQTDNESGDKIQIEFDLSVDKKNWLLDAGYNIEIIEPATNLQLIMKKNNTYYGYGDFRRPDSFALGVSK